MVIFYTRKEKRKKGMEGSGNKEEKKMEKGIPMKVNFIAKFDGVFLNRFYI